MQAIQGFHLIAVVKVITNEPEQAGESFQAGFTVAHGLANLRKGTIEGSVVRGKDVFGRSKFPSETFVQRSLPTVSPFQEVEGVNEVCVRKKKEISDYKAHRFFHKTEGFSDGSRRGEQEGRDLLDLGYVNATQARQTAAS